MAQGLQVPHLSRGVQNLISVMKGDVKFSQCFDGFWRLFGDVTIWHDTALYGDTMSFDLDTFGRFQQKHTLK